MLLLITTRYYVSLVLVLLSLSAFTQSNIYGKVVDERDNSPLKGASVYFNNTTLGTYTNQQGDFQFETIRMLGTELVIYAPGFEIVVFNPMDSSLQGKKFVFKLKAKEAPAESIIVIDQALRNKCLAVFRENFLGITEEADKCTILNKSAIYFTRGGSQTSLSAYSDTPLVIINDMLGYKINFNLVEFWYDGASGQNYFLGYARYESLGNNKKWNKNRKNCYLGSTLHFYRSLVTHQLYQQGFGTFLIQPLKDTGVTGMPEGASLMSAHDSMMAVPVSAHEILYIDSANNLSIRSSGKMLVQYNKDPSSKIFLAEKILFEALYLPKGFESYIVFKASPIGITLAGVLSDPTYVAYSGYWIYERLANILPYDYEPG